MPELFIQNKTTVIRLMALCILSALVELSVVKAESLIIDYGLLRSNYRNVLYIGLGLLVLLSVELVTNLFRSKYAEQLASDGNVEKVGVAPEPKQVDPASQNLEYG